MHLQSARGLAYMASHHYEESVNEFKKILDQRGIVAGDPIGTLALLQIARSYRSMGNAAKANSAYQQFFAVLQNPDPGIPVANQAMSESLSGH